MTAAADLERALHEQIDRQIGIRSTRALMKRNAHRWGAARALEVLQEARGLGACTAGPTFDQVSSPRLCLCYGGDMPCLQALRERLEQEVAGA